ncbi:hypothetical protein BU25DRAFT_467714, partial [Macroventuria anomochaeta]
MSLSDSIVPKLRQDGTNHFHWERAFQLYAKSQGYSGLLNGTWEEPTVIKGLTQMEPSTINSVYTDEVQLRAAQISVREHNRLIKEQYSRDWAQYRRWQSACAALELVLLSTVPQPIYESVNDLTDVADQFNTIIARYRDQGVTEECSIWADFFKLRAHECNTTTTFVDKFKAGLARLTHIQDCKLTDKQAVY